MTREPFCSACPDHEACATGAPCTYVKAVAARARDDGALVYQRFLSATQPPFKHQQKRPTGDLCWCEKHTAPCPMPEPMTLANHLIGEFACRTMPMHGGKKGARNCRTCCVDAAHLAHMVEVYLSASEAEAFRKHREFTVLRRVDDRWKPMGPPGSLGEVKDTMDAWRRAAPDAVFAYGQRDVGPWTLGDEK